MAYDECGDVCVGNLLCMHASIAPAILCVYVPVCLCMCVYVHVHVCVCACIRDVYRAGGRRRGSFLKP